MGHVQEFQGWLILIESEYREMPGLHLTERQAQRLWGLDREMCSDLLATLVAMGVLWETPEHAYTLAGGTA